MPEIDPSDPSIDPFSRAHEAIWRALEASQGWVALVTSANRLNETDTGKTDARNRGRRVPSNFNEFNITQGDFKLMPGKNSKSYGFRQSFVFSIGTDALKVVDANQLKFVTLAALLTKGNELGLPGFIDDWNPRDWRDLKEVPATTDASANRGYAVMGTIDVDFYLAAAAIIAATSTVVG